MPKHGQYIDKGEWRGSRWCAVHGHHHGHLFPCEHYDDDLLETVNADADRFRRNLSDPEWIADQNLPPAVIAILRAFAGVES